MERQKFENAWRDALAGAEQSPSENVWMGIDSKLTVAEGGTMKRRVIFYQRLAAASILFAVVFGSLTAYYINENNSQTGDDRLAEGTLNNGQLINGQLADDKAAENQLVNEQLADDRLANDNKDVTRNSTGTNEQTDLTKKKNNSNITIQKQSVLLADNNEGAGDEPDITPNELRYRHQNFASLSSKDIPSPEVSVSGKVEEVSIKRKLPAMPASMMADSRKDKKSEKENFWASIGASTGNYSPQGNFNQSQVMAAQGSFSNMVSNSNYSGTTSSPSKGTAYSVGVNVARKVSDRWIVLGGLSYLNQAAGYTTNLASISSNNTPSVYSADYASQQSNSSRAVTLTSPYEINSVNEFVSVPVQAGYLVVNRKVGFQVNSGVATDIFLQNTLTDKSGQLNKLTENGGSDSPYNSFSWSAIIGSELSYKLGDQYRVSLVPGLRYSLSPVLKSNSITSNPMVWDLGFRFRYIFK